MAKRMRPQQQLLTPSSSSASASVNAPVLNLADLPLPNSWLTAVEWSRLYRCTRPTKLSEPTFQKAAQSGNLDDLKAVVIAKLCRELRLIMTERGWFDEVRPLANYRGKSEGISLIRQGVSMSIEAKAAAVSSLQELHAANGGAQAGSSSGADEHTAPNRAASPSVSEQDDALIMSSPRAYPQPAAVTRDPPLNSSAASSSWSTVPTPHGNGAKAAVAGNRSSTLHRSVEAAAAALLSKPALPTTQFRPLTAISSSLPSAATNGSRTTNACPSALASSIPTPLAPLQAPYATPSELELYSSPMTRVIVILRRFQLRMGSYPVRFDIPQQYLADLGARRLRVHVVPMTGNQPSVWPKIKEVFVFVNERNVQAVWKRTWPDKKAMDVTKAYLPLDVTQYLLNPLHQNQRLQLDCFNHEFCGSFAVVLVAPRTEADVMEEWRAQLTRGLSELQPFYTSMLRVDNAAGDDDDVQCEVPTVALKCPISQTRIQVPVRGRHCRHLQCVDFAAFLRYCHISCYWNCPMCDATMRLRDVVVDGPFYEMLQKPTSFNWSHAQLVAEATTQPNGAPPRMHWSQSEKHKSSAVDLSSSDDEDDSEEGDGEDNGVGTPPLRKRRTEVRGADETSPSLVGSLGAAGSAEEPICL